jgi:hypothetical protein
MPDLMSARRDVMPTPSASTPTVVPTPRIGPEQHRYTLLGPGGAYQSSTPGTLGGYKRGRIYGRLDCPSALRAVARGHYARHRVFFADEATARATGYRPCRACLPETHAVWKGTQPARR